MSNQNDLSTPQSHYERIEGFVTGEGYAPSAKKSVSVSTRVHHVLGEAERLATDVLYDLMEEMNSERVEWLRIGHESEAACYARMISKVEEKIKSVRHPRA